MIHALYNHLYEKPARTPILSEGPCLMPSMFVVTRTKKLTAFEAIADKFKTRPNTYKGRTTRMITKELKAIYPSVRQASETLRIKGQDIVLSLAYDVVEGSRGHAFRVYVVVDYLGIITQWTACEGHVQTYRDHNGLFIYNTDRCQYLSETRLI